MKEIWEHSSVATEKSTGARNTIRQDLYKLPNLLGRKTEVCAQVLSEIITHTLGVKPLLFPPVKVI